MPILRNTGAREAKDRKNLSHFVEMDKTSNPINVQRIELFGDGGFCNHQRIPFATTLTWLWFKPNEVKKFKNNLVTPYEKRFNVMPSKNFRKFCGTSTLNMVKWSPLCPYTSMVQF